MSLKIKDIPKEERPRERLRKYNANSLSNSELLAIIVGKGYRNKNALELATHILKENNLQELSQSSVGSLSQVPGIGKAKASQIIACFELGRRLSSFKIDINPEITCAEDVYVLLGPSLELRKREHLVGLFLDTRKKLIKKETIFIGTLDTSIIHPREILKIAIRESSAAIIIVHNHPSGDPSPSQEDIEITQQIVKAGDLVGIPVLDHVIIGSTNFVSLRKEISGIF